MTPIEPNAAKAVKTASCVCGSSGLPKPQAVSLVGDNFLQRGKQTWSAHFEDPGKLDS